MKDEQLEPKVRFHHVGVVVKSISEAIDKYSSALGIDKRARSFDGLKVFFSFVGLFAGWVGILASKRSLCTSIKPFHLF